MAANRGRIVATPQHTIEEELTKRADVIGADVGV